MKKIESISSFGGHQEVWEHDAESLGVPMRFGIYLPPQARSGSCPVLYWLSGLTCTEQNFITKAGAQRYAAEHGVIVVAPDSSPHGDTVPDDDAYDLGQGAAFYLNATQAPWAEHFSMARYVSEELPTLIAKHFPNSGRSSISGHSMGGHGALVLAFKNPGRYQSVSAFSPIVAPTQVPWGQKAFAAYLGDDKEEWRQWDACELVHRAKEHLPLLIDQGDADPFLAEQLKPQLFEAACASADYAIDVRMQPGYDHSYYFIASFIGEHIAFHAAALK